MKIPWLGFGRAPPKPTGWATSKDRQKFLALMLEAESIAAVRTYHVRPDDMGAAMFDIFVLNHLVPEGIIWC
jgi:hypothetical protein